jgi:predicted Holliday junction resolvase-like endonuclease
MSITKHPLALVDKLAILENMNLQVVILLSLLCITIHTIQQLKTRVKCLERMIINNNANIHVRVEELEKQTTTIAKTNHTKLEKLQNQYNSIISRSDAVVARQVHI